MNRLSDYMKQYLEGLSEDERYRELYDINLALDERSIIAITDARGTITYANSTFCAISGYSQEELIGQNHSMLNSGFHPKGFFKEMWGVISSGQVWRAEICNRGKGGHLYWVDTTIIPFKNDHGEIYKYLAIRNEITENKLLQIALNSLVELSSENPEIGYFSSISKTLCEVLDINAAVISSFDDQQSHILACWNEQGECSPSLLQNINQAMIQIPEEQEFFDLSYCPVLPKEKSNSLAHVLRDDQGKAIACLAILDTKTLRHQEALKKILGLYGKRIEIELKRRVVLQELKESESRMKAVIDTAVDGIIICNQAGVIESLNPAAQSLFLIPPRKKAKNIQSLLPQIPIESLAENTSGQESIGICFDSSSIPIYYTHSSFEFKGELFYTIFVRNLSEQKEAEEKLAQAEQALNVQTLFNQRLSALAAMAGGIAHELNQPLSGIRLYAQMIDHLAQDGKKIKPEKVSETMGKIIKQVDRTAQIIQHIRQFSSDKKNTKTHAETVAIAEVFQSSLDLIGQQITNHGIELVNKIDPLHLISFNKTRLEQIFINLLSNAKDSIDEKNDGAGEIEIHSKQVDNSLQLFIRDTGTGIKEEVQHKLFEPFITSKDPGVGTGLGLSICVGILRDYDANIQLYHSSPQGSTFLITFPGV